MIYVSLVLSVISFILCVFILFSVKRIVQCIKEHDHVIEGNLEIAREHNKALGNLIEIIKKAKLS